MNNNIPKITQKQFNAYWCALNKLEDNLEEIQGNLNNISLLIPKVQDYIINTELLKVLRELRELEHKYNHFQCLQIQYTLISNYIYALIP
jgi:hypothetical protein